MPVVGRVFENPTSGPVRFIGIRYRKSCSRLFDLYDSPRAENQKTFLISEGFKLLVIADETRK